MDWQHFLRRLGDLKTRVAQPIPPELEGPDVAATLRAATGDPDLHLVRLDGETWVRVDFERTSGDGSSATCWRRVGTPDVEVVLPSVLWFLLKIGLFVVGAIVFWKRPEDHSAAQFFVLCLVTIGAYMGGYHWLYIVTQPAAAADLHGVRRAAAGGQPALLPALPPAQGVHAAPAADGCWR